ASYRLKLPADMRKRGVHDVFHAELLRPYVANDDVRFPDRSWHGIATVPLSRAKHSIAEIVGHKKLNEGFVFYAKWGNG
ncbi:hypothetical protein AURDEDRAFT_31431, partial [Auricularia subglabra TFB-10046 SS5]